MEIHIRFGHLHQITFGCALLEILCCQFQFPHILVCHIGAGLLNSHIFQSDSYLQNIVQILLRNVGNLGTSSWDHHHQALKLQLTHGLTDGSSAHS